MNAVDWWAMWNKQLLQEGEGTDGCGEGGERIAFEAQRRQAGQQGKLRWNVLQSIVLQ